MVKYRLNATVDASDLQTVITAATAAALRHDFDPVITLSVLHPKADEPIETHAVVDPPPRRMEPKKKNFAQAGAWPADGSIYSIVLQALQDGPKKPNDLRIVLKDNGFSPGSVNSSLRRLQDKGKARPTGEGAWTAA